MSKKNPNNGDDVTGAAGFAKIARGLSDLFNVLADFDQLPRRGRHEKDGRVMGVHWRELETHILLTHQPDVALLCVEGLSRTTWISRSG